MTAQSEAPTRPKALVLYHASCADGAGAAYAVWRKLGDNAEYRPMQYNREPPPTDDEVRGRDVYFIDFSLPRAELVRIASTARSVLVLDHHKTAAAELEGLPFAIFDMGRSGATITWTAFHPATPVPDVLRYVEDRDLWRWALPDSKEISAAMRALGVTEDFRRFDTLPGPKTLAQMGAAILLDQAQTIRSICDNAMERTLDGHRILVVNAPVFQSEVAGALAADRPFGAAWFLSKEGKTVVSLRVRDGDIDVSAIAKRRGGGGHAKAAGFTALARWDEIFDPA